jgi:hypothetical protein
MQAILNGKRSLNRNKSLEKLSEIDKIFGEDTEENEMKDYYERKHLDLKIMKGRFFGAPGAEHNDNNFDLQNSRDTFKLRFFQSALTFYSRIVSMMESIIHESSSTHHSTDFIKCSQKHILLKGKVSHTIRILDELLDPKHHMAHPLISLFDDYIQKLTGENDMLRTLWKWMVRNSKIMNAVLKRITVIEVVEDAQRVGGGRHKLLKTFSQFWVQQSLQRTRLTFLS